MILCSLNMIFFPQMNCQVLPKKEDTAQPELVSEIKGIYQISQTTVCSHSGTLPSFFLQHLTELWCVFFSEANQTLEERVAILEFQVFVFLFEADFKDMTFQHKFELCFVPTDGRSSK